MVQKSWSCHRVVEAEVLMYISSFIILISVTLPYAESLVSSIFRSRYVIISNKYKSLYLSMAYTLFLPLLSYVYSQAKQSKQEIRAQIILLWMVLIEIIQVRSANYSPWDLRKSAGQLVQIFWVGYLVSNSAPLQGIKVGLFLLCIYSAVSEVLKAIMINKAKESYLIGNNPKLINNYMKRIMLQEDLRTTPMNMCDYIVMGEENHDIHDCSNGNCLGEKKSNTRGMLTVGGVFDLHSSQDHGMFTSEYPNYRDNCLSLALAKILKRRFAKVPVNEAGCRKALDFVEGLIAYFDRNRDIQTDGNDGERKPADMVFRIIQEELKFVSDFLHMEIPTYYYFPRLVIIDLIGVSIMIGNILYLLVFIPWLYVITKTETNECFFQFHGYGSVELNFIFFFVCNTTITVCLFYASICTVCSWIRVLYTERWLNLIFVKFYIKDPAKWTRNYSLWAIRMSTKIVFSIPANIIKKVLPYKKPRVYSTVLDVSIMARLPKWIRTNIPRLSPTGVHSTDAKDAILRSLKNSGGRLTNGETSLTNFGMENLNWACQPTGNSTEAILVWHIATTLFHHQEPSPQQNNNPINKEKEVALVLSSYCHYLVESLPELLPDDVKWTENMYESVIKEMLAIQWYWMPCRAHSVRNARLNYAMHATWVQSSIVGKGTMLAKDLMKSANDGKQVWNMLAEFWAEMMIFIAPSENVDGHEKILHQEEMITQLWALLTHAGIVTRPEPIEHHDYESESNAVTRDMNV